MIIPSFLNENDCVGVTACSSGVLPKIEQYEKTIKVFENNGFKIVETPNVRTDGVVSSDPLVRATQLESLFTNDRVKMIAVARGGDFLSDMLTDVDFDLIAKYPKWLCGSSDPTSLLYVLTTRYDIASIYSPCNMTGMDKEPLDESFNNYFKILKGNLIKQHKSDKCEKEAFSDEHNANNEWVNINGDVNSEGILIGGCIEVLKDIIGTKFDYTKDFLEKYKDEGIVWYFDVFSMTTENLFNTLIQFKNAGWFKYTDTILVGKVAFPSSFSGMSYEEVIAKALPDIKIVYRFDVGHVKPSFTMINGLKVRIISNDNEHSLEYLQ